MTKTKEFEFSGDADVKITGEKILLEIPQYMTKLPANEIQELSKLSLEERKSKALASGYDVKTGDIVVITAACEIFELNPGAHGLPAATCVPCDHGQTLQLPNVYRIVDGKRVGNGLYEIDVGWFLLNAKKVRIEISDA